MPTIKSIHARERFSTAGETRPLRLMSTWRTEVLAGLRFHPAPQLENMKPLNYGMETPAATSAKVS